MTSAHCLPAKITPYRVCSPVFTSRVDGSVAKSDFGRILSQAKALQANFWARKLRSSLCALADSDADADSKRDLFFGQTPFLVHSIPPFRERSNFRASLHYFMMLADNNYAAILTVPVPPRLDNGSLHKVKSGSIPKFNFPISLKAVDIFRERHDGP